MKGSRIGAQLSIEIATGQRETPILARPFSPISKLPRPRDKRASKHNCNHHTGSSLWLARGDFFRIFRSPVSIDREIRRGAVASTDDNCIDTTFSPRRKESEKNYEKSKQGNDLLSLNFSSIAHFRDFYCSLWC